MGLEELKKLAEVSLEDLPGGQWYVNDACLHRTLPRGDASFMVAASPAVILALIARVEASDADAERYRWLRGMIWDESCFIGPEHMKRGEELDSAIDQARGEK